MIHDLRTILDGWEYEPGKISVRKIIGRDGREKVQTRVDLGLLQLEVSGRPDGLRPHGCDTYLDYCEQRLREHGRKPKGEEEFELTAEECAELRHELHLFYQRFLSMFVLEEFACVERDTAHNLRILDLCRQYGPSDHDRTVLEGQRAYVTMMNVRARVYSDAAREDFVAALHHLDEGVTLVQQLRDEQETPAVESDGSPELHVLANLREEIYEMMPGNAPLRLRWELQKALAREDYEQAAALRDQLAEGGQLRAARPRRPRRKTG